VHWLPGRGSLWEYLAIGALSFITEELAPVGAGFAAHEGQLGLLRVALSVFLGTWLTTIALYFVGRSRGAWLRRRFPQFGRLFTRALMFVRRRPWRASFAVRYAFGLRWPLPIACGAAHIPVWAFVIGSGISSLTWASLFTVVGWTFGRSAAIVMNHLHRYEDVIGLAATGLVGIALFAYLRRSTLADNEEEVTAFGKELDRLSGEFPVMPDDDANVR
jgi:membrane protein DedA with SNARE-associated domain